MLHLVIIEPMNRNVPLVFNLDLLKVVFCFMYTGRGDKIRNHLAMIAFFSDYVFDWLEHVSSDNNITLYRKLLKSVFLAQNHYSPYIQLLN